MRRMVLVGGMVFCKSIDYHFEHIRLIFTIYCLQFQSSLACTNKFKEQIFRSTSKRLSFTDALKECKSHSSNHGSRVHLMSIGKLRHLMQVVILLKMTNRVNKYDILY
jgi:hypothetical protein